VPCNAGRCGQRALPLAAPVAAASESRPHAPDEARSRRCAAEAQVRRLFEGPCDAQPAAPRVPWNKGQQLSEETRAKMAAAKRGRRHSSATRSRMSAAAMGRRHSEVCAAAERVFVVAALALLPTSVRPARCAGHARTGLRSRGATPFASMTLQGDMRK
jgi:NUMOD3 motif